MTTLRRTDLIYPELSYKIIGCAFDVYNSLGSGHHEKYYQRALAETFFGQNFNFSQQVDFPLKYKEKIIGRNFLDFLVDNKIVVEIKRGNIFLRQILTK